MSIGSRKFPIIIFQLILLFLLITPLVSCTFPTATRTNPFDYIPEEEADLKPDQERLFRKYKNNPYTKEIRIFQPKIRYFNQRRETVILNLFGTQKYLPLSQIQISERKSPRTFHWSGKSITDSPSYADIRFKNSEAITGQVQSRADIYDIRSITGGYSVLILKVEEPDDEFKIDEQSNNSSSSTFSSSPAKTHSSQSLKTDIVLPYIVEENILVAYTKEAITDEPYLIETLNDTFEDINKKIIPNSNLTLKLNPTIYEIKEDYIESGTIKEKLNYFRNENDGVLDEIHKARSESHSDIALLILNNAGGCGQAFTIGSTTPDTAFAVIDRSCARSYFTLIHEVAHLHGSRHNIERDPTETPFKYGHAYCERKNVVRTIVAKKCPDIVYTKIPYFSNPNVLYPPDTSSTQSRPRRPLGNITYADNVRVITESAQRISQYY